MINRDDLPRIVAGARMPTFERMDQAEGARRIEAEIGSKRLGEAIDRYVDNGGRW